MIPSVIIKALCSHFLLFSFDIFHSNSIYLVSTRFIWLQFDMYLSLVCSQPVWTPSLKSFPAGHHFQKRWGKHFLRSLRKWSGCSPARKPLRNKPAGSCLACQPTPRVSCRRSTKPHFNWAPSEALLPFTPPLYVSSEGLSGCVFERPDVSCTTAKSHHGQTLAWAELPFFKTLSRNPL